MLPDSRALVEMAQASGLERLTADVLAATSRLVLVDDHEIRGGGTIREVV